MRSGRKEHRNGGSASVPEFVTVGERVISWQWMKRSASWRPGAQAGRSLLSMDGRDRNATDGSEQDGG